MSALRHVVRGVFAAAVLAAVGVAVPWLLVATVGNPWPGRTAVELRDTTRALTGILAVLAWLLWARFIVALAVETVDQTARHRQQHTIGQPATVVPAPPDDPAGGGSLGLLAHWLIAAVLALVLTFRHPPTATAEPAAGLLPARAVAAVVEHGDPPPPTVTTAATTVQPATTAQLRARNDGSTSTVVVAPGDTLIGLARTHLGDQARWREIFELNRDRPQPGGGQLTTPSLIRSGWTLHLPAPNRATTNGPGRPVHVVTAGDSYWQIAEQDLRRRLERDPTDAEIHHQTNQLIADNAPRLGYADPALLRPGDHVTVARPPNRDTAATPGTLDPGRPVHVVAAGDSYWSISEDQLRLELDREPTDREVLERTDASMAANVARLGYDDPAMLHPGDVLRPVSAASAPPSPTTAEPSPSTPNDPPSRPRPRPPIAQPDTAPAPPPPAGPVAPADTISAPSADAPTPTTPTPAEVPSISVPPPQLDRPPVTVEADHDVAGLFDRSPRSLWWSIPTGLLLAAGLVSMTRRLRSRRLSRLEPGEQLASPPPVASGTELAVSAGDPQQRLATLQGLLRTITPYAREQSDPPPVRSVELANDRVEVVFAAPAPFPPPGWTTINGGRSWVHRLTHPSSPPVQQLVTPALVTLGLRSGGGEVLLDLETAGSLALAGDRAAAVGMARAMALELATYPLGVPIDVCPIGFDVDGVDLCDRAWRGTTLTRAVRVARELLASTASTAASSLVAARAATDTDQGLLDPQVFLVDGASVEGDDVGLLDELVELCIPQSGAAVVIIGDHPAARERVEVESVDAICWSGAELLPTALDREAVAQVAVTFDHAANAAAEPLTPSPVVADLIAGVEASDHDVTGNGDEPGPVVAAAVDEVEPYRYLTPDHDVLVRVLGDVTVEGRPVTAAGDVELLTLLAFKRDHPPNLDTLQALLIKRGGKKGGDSDNPLGSLRDDDATLKTLRNRVWALRKLLGAGSDGSDLLPLARDAVGRKGRYLLSPKVLTDVDLIEHRYHTATALASGDALPVLREGLSLFAGPAFRGPRSGYGWIGPETVSGRIANVVNAYATLLMQLAFDVDDLALVLQAAAAAGRVIDDPVALLPMCEVQRQFAEASGDPDLAAAVLEAHRRLLAHAEQHDPLAGA